MAEETVAVRYSREWLAQNDDRKEYGLDDQSTERKDRLFVDPVTGESAVTGNIAPGFEDEDEDEEEDEEPVEQG